MDESRLDPATSALRWELARLLSPEAAQWLWFPIALVLAFIAMRLLVRLALPPAVRLAGFAVRWAVIVLSWALLALDWAAASAHRAIAPVLTGPAYAYGDGVVALGSAACERTGAFTAHVDASMRGEPRKWAWGLLGVLFLLWNVAARDLGPGGVPTWPALAWLQWIFLYMKQAA